MRLDPRCLWSVRLRGCAATVCMCTFSIRMRACGCACSLMAPGRAGSASPWLGSDILSGRCTGSRAVGRRWWCAPKAKTPATLPDRSAGTPAPARSVFGHSAAGSAGGAAAARVARCRDWTVRLNAPGAEPGRYRELAQVDQRSSWSPVTGTGAAGVYNDGLTRSRPMARIASGQAKRMFLRQVYLSK